MVKLFIPCHENRRSPAGQLYTVYRIEVYHNGSWNRIEKRYNDFYKLHKEMKKLCSTPKFPPKKMMRNLSNTVIEERRSQLENYLQELIKNELTQPNIFQFLGLSQLEETKIHSEWNQIRPLSMIAFSNDLLNSPSDDDNEGLEGSSPSSLPDIVLKGALEAFYSTNHEDFYYKI